MFPRYIDLPQRLKREVDARVADAGVPAQQVSDELFASAVASEIRRLIARLTPREGILVAMDFDVYEQDIITMCLSRANMEFAPKERRRKIRVFAEKRDKAFLKFLL